MGYGPIDVIGDDEEVVRIPHLDDDVEFVIEALYVVIILSKSLLF